MQITFTFSQNTVSWIRDIFNILLLPMAGWLYKHAKLSFNRIITDNSNRIRDELKIFLDAKFESHEENAFERITALERSVKELADLVHKYGLDKQR